MESVGQELLHHMKGIEDAVSKATDGVCKAKYVSFWIDSSTFIDNDFETVLPIIRSLEKAGFKEDEVKRGHDVRRTFRHPELDDRSRVEVIHRIDAREQLEELLKQQATLQSLIKTKKEEIQREVVAG